MKIKKCSNPKCKQPKKPVTEFYKNKIIKSGLSSWCKDCHKEMIQEHHRKYPWKRTLHDIIQRCENPNNSHFNAYGGRGIENSLSLEDIKFLWFRDKAHDLNVASIHRKNNNKNYTISNCQYIEKQHNTELALCKPILQYNSDGKLIKEWVSIKKTSKILKIPYIPIIICLNNEFIWRYK